MLVRINSIRHLPYPAKIKEMPYYTAVRKKSCHLKLKIPDSALTPFRKHVRLFLAEVYSGFPILLESHRNEEFTFYQLFASKGWPVILRSEKKLPLWFENTRLCAAFLLHKCQHISGLSIFLRRYTRPHNDFPSSPLSYLFSWQVMGETVLLLSIASGVCWR